LWFVELDVGVGLLSVEAGRKKYCKLN